MNILTALTFGQLDEIDLGIIDHLSQDGRRSNARIAAALGVGQWIVKKRIDRLLSSGACEILAIVNPERLGYGTGALVGLETEPDKGAAVVAQLATLDEVTWTGRTMSRFSVLAEVRLPRSAGMFELTCRISRIPGVLSTSTFLILRQTFFSAAGWSSPSTLEKGGTSRPSATWTGDGSELATGNGQGPNARRLDALDERIVGLLMRDGRRSAAEIARITGVSPSAVTVRIDRLIKQGFCRVTAVLEPEKLGLTSHSVVGIRVDPSRMAEIGQTLTCVPRVFWVCQLSGWYDILADVWLSDATDLLDFVTEHILSIPGVRSAEAFGIEDTEVRGAPAWQYADSTSMRKSNSRRVAAGESGQSTQPPRGE